MHLLTRIPVVFEEHLTPPGSKLKTEHRTHSVEISVRSPTAIY